MLGVKILTKCWKFKSNHFHHFNKLCNTIGCSTTVAAEEAGDPTFDSESGYIGILVLKNLFASLIFIQYVKYAFFVENRHIQYSPNVLLYISALA
jgi:hypothetical protein